MNFYFGPGDQPHWIVHVFSTSTFSGGLRNGVEGELHWFSEEAIPYDSMWADDRYWLPALLEGRRFDATFWFDEDAEKLLRHQVRVI